jgi:hypothetical protein
VYRCLSVIIAIALFILSAVFGHIVDFLERRGDLRVEDVPRELLDIVPIVFVVIGIMMVVISIVAVIGAIGVLKRQEWGRIVLIVVSFFNLIRAPLGTVLGVYSLWVLLNDEIVRMFNPLHNAQSNSPASQA